MIGISEYYPVEPEKGPEDLLYADDDALAFLDALIYNYSVPRENIQLLIAEEGSTGNATRAEIFSSIAWIAGKSTEKDDVIIYFSGHGTGLGKLAGIVAQDKEVIWDYELTSNIKAIVKRRVAVILDSCHSAGFADDLDIQNVLAMMASRGRAFEEGHGIFTYWFVVKGIIEGKANSPDNPHWTDDPYIPFEEAYDYTFHNLKRQSKPKIVDNFPDDFYPA